MLCDSERERSPRSPEGDETLTGLQRAGKQKSILGCLWDSVMIRVFWRMP